MSTMCNLIGLGSVSTLLVKVTPTKGRETLSDAPARPADADGKTKTNATKAPNAVNRTLSAFMTESLCGAPRAVKKREPKQFRKTRWPSSMECGGRVPARRDADAAFDCACAQHLARVPAKAVSPSCFA
jgi:hypothetical protein